jgi:hypothetical protein
MGKIDIAWSIETTGFSAHNELTVSGFLKPPESDSLDETEVVVYFNTAGGLRDDEDISRLTRYVEEAYGSSVRLIPCESEADILAGMERYVTSSMEFRDERLVAYDGEKWHVSYKGDRRDGAALPQLRTRCIRNDVGWVLNGVPFTNLSELAQYSLNNQPLDLSQMSVEELSDFGQTLGDARFQDEALLDESHEALVYMLNDHGFSEHDLEAWNATRDDPVSRVSLRTSIGADGILVEWNEKEDFDPFNDGGKAANAFVDRNFEDLILHNIANLVRTSQLATLITEYASSRYVDELRL